MAAGMAFPRDLFFKKKPKYQNMKMKRINFEENVEINLEEEITEEMCFNYSNNEKKKSSNQKLENNIFFEIDNQLTPLTANAVLVINKENNNVQ